MNNVQATHYTLTAEQKSEFYKKMIAIAIPVIIKNMISIGLGMADTMMIGKLGEEQLAGVGAAQSADVVVLGARIRLFQRCCSARFAVLGRGDVHRVRNVLGLDFLVGALAGILTVASTYLLGPQLVWRFRENRL